MTIKKWFLNKEFSQSERYAISATDNCKTERESEKAILLKWDTEFGIISKWIPKSCIEDFSAQPIVENTENNLIVAGCSATTLDGTKIIIESVCGIVAKATNGKSYIASMLK